MPGPLSEKSRAGFDQKLRKSWAKAAQVLGKTSACLEEKLRRSLGITFIFVLKKQENNVSNIT
jgi:hypothetical protein